MIHLERTRERVQTGPVLWPTWIGTTTMGGVIVFGPLERS